MRDRFSIISSAGIIAVACTALVMTTSCKGKEKKQGGMPPAPVSAAAVERRDVPVQITIIGTVEPSSTVAVKAQVGGTLMKVHFIEGQDVRKGDLLFTIDPRPFEAALRQAEANLARSKAQYENARAEERRYAELVQKGYVSQTQYDQVRTNAESLDATVQADRALFENAKLNLAYCTIRSPLDGRTGSLDVHEGNIVKANADTPMVTINRIQPVNVGFSLPENSLAEIRRYMQSGALMVNAFASKDDPELIRGRLSFIDNTVDTATGTIKLKASFDNGDRKLWPGQFVNVVITLTVRKDATVVPTAAVQTGQQGLYVFVLKGDVAELRPVIAGTEHNGMTIIEKGVEPGEQVVTDGQVRIIPGGKVVLRYGNAEEEKTDGTVKAEETNKAGAGGKGAGLKAEEKGTAR